jgi:hypothetical protein
MSSVKLVCSSAVNLSTSSSPLRLRGGDGIKLLLHDSSESSSVPKPACYSTHDQHIYVAQTYDTVSRLQYIRTLKHATVMQTIMS